MVKSNHFIIDFMNGFEAFLSFHSAEINYVTLHMYQIINIKGNVIFCISIKIVKVYTQKTSHVFLYFLFASFCCIRVITFALSTPNGSVFNVTRID